MPNGNAPVTVTAEVSASSLGQRLHQRFPEFLEFTFHWIAPFVFFGLRG